MILLVLRHAKAEKDSPSGRDFDRPLAPKGLRQVTFLSGRLREGGKPPLARPQVIAASAATRARQTAEGVAEALALPVTFEEALKPDRPVEQALELVRKLAEGGQPALIVGHNPQLEDLLEVLAVADTELRTGELVVLDVEQKSGTLSAKEAARLRLGEED